MALRSALRRLSLRARLTMLLLGVAAVLLATLGVQLGYQRRLATERDDLVNHVDREAETLGELRTATIDQVSGVWGYTLTGDERFLATYEQGRAATDDALARLGRQVRRSESDQGEAADYEAIRVALSDWRRDTADPAVDPSPGAGRTVRSAAFLAEGQARFAAVRDAIDTLDRHLMAERATYVQQLDRTYRAMTVALIVELAALVLFGMVVAVALSRLVLSPLARLGWDARMVANGDLGHAVKGEGPPELVRLGDDVEAMRARIVAELDELTAARADLERQARELARSNADLEQFAYVASHDLQEPLRKVSGFCQLLERRYADQLDERAREYIRYAADAAKRMQALINDLLAFARVGRSDERFRPVDLGDAAREAVEALAAPIAASGATVTIEDLPVVSGDPRLLGLVFQNLIGNAVKFRSKAPPRVDVTAICEDGRWMVSVADNGIGVDPLYADQIFTLFGRLHHKSEYEGTGIGLALSKKIVEFHGGRIWLESSSKQGATFAFALPASGPSAPTTRNESHDAHR